VKWGEVVPRDASARATVALLALALVVFSPLVLGRVLFERDIQTFWLAQVETFVRAVAAGCWPVWDPWVTFGQPMLAQPDTQVLYPFTWLNLILPPGPVYSLYVLVHLLLAGLGSFRLARRLGTGGGGAFVAGAVFMLSGPLVSLANLWHHLAGASWMPWVLEAAQSTSESGGKLRPALRWGLLTGVQLLAGSADMAVMTALLAACLAGRQLLAGERPTRTRLRTIGSGLAALALGLGLSAALWLPTLEVARRSARWALPATTRQYWSFHPLSLAQVGLPLFVVDLPLQERWRLLLSEGREPFLESVYVGLPALALAAAALLARARHSLLLAGIAGLSSLVALGRHTPVYSAALALVPPLSILRYPQKALVPAALALGLLAGCGFEAWSRASFWRFRRRSFVIGLGFAALAAVVALGTVLWGGEWLGRATLLPPVEMGAGYREVWAPVAGHLAAAAVAATAVLAAAAAVAAGRSSADRSALAVGALAVGTLLAAHRTLHPSASPELLASRSPILQVLRATPDTRVFTYDYGAVPGSSERYLGRRMAQLVDYLPRGWSYREGVALGLQQYLPSPMGARFGIYGSFDQDQRGLYPRELDALTRLVWASDDTPPARVRLLQLGGVSHVVALHGTGFEPLIEVGRFPSVYADPIRVFRVPQPLPRTYVVEGTRSANDREALAALLDAHFDFRREVLLAEGLPSRRADDGFAGESRLVTYLPDRVEMAVSASRAGIVVLLDSFDPGWRAWVDGKPERVLRANVSFRAVHVPAGSHRVEMRYRPRAVYGGLVVSAVSAVLALSALFLRRPAAA
jgi:hypothetical protein